ncbi:hypothetical protein H6F43_16125 [Leptolyngbya sp. FACHB-36]|uniref:hypothetical protein n=1 Tax=Leptolyngbya sp. FACHB-36 TaxID=2692808 RepID=UPI0016808982|nr:hypothetical protein [Leptolyngbya sp. FACHB-36]MBD2021708.1 hypothetical protein [Leptolyngbya sp. FACHB-36]
MLSQHQRSVCLSVVSTDLPVASGVETVGTLYQKDHERFDLVLTEPIVQDYVPAGFPTPVPAPRLVWLELSPYRVAMTVQGNGQFSYRHLWEQGIYGPSRYWLSDAIVQVPQSLPLRNFTRSLVLQGRPLPTLLRVEYELWSGALPLGRYVLNLDIHH